MRKYILFTALILSSILNINAAEFAAGQITYVNTGGNNYEITLAYYSDCSAGIPDTIQLAHFECSVDTLLNFTQNLHLFSTQAVSNSNCPSSCNGGDSTIFGSVEYLYRATVNLPNCSDWLIYCTDSSRNSVNTIIGKPNWFIAAQIDNSVVQSSSPIMTVMPIFFVCISQQTCLNQGLYDPNGDSLSVSFSCPKTTSMNSVVIHIPPYFTGAFLSSSTAIYTNPFNGKLCFNATQILSAIEGSRIEKWRTINGVATLIGVVYRDMQIRVISCNNQNPVLSGMDFTSSGIYNSNDTTIFTEIEAENTLSFSINATDPDVFNSSNSGSPEKITLYETTGALSSQINFQNNGTDSAYANFLWQPTLNDVDTLVYELRFLVKDSACRVLGADTMSISIKVKPRKPKLGNDTSICINHQLILTADSGNFIYQWSTGDTTQSIVVDSNNLNLGNNNIILQRTGYGYVQSDTISIIMNACTGIYQNQKNDLELKLLPNPSNGIFEISYLSNSILQTNIYIYNAMGKLAYSQEFISQKSNNRKKVNISHFPKGVYLLVFKQGKEQVQKKLIIL